MPIVPVLLEGLYEIMDREASWPGKGRARVTVGEPFDPLAGGMTDPDAIAARIEASVRNLKG